MCLSESRRFLAFARACLGTPFHHQGRKPGIGLDCIGLVVCALESVGFEVRDQKDYARRPNGKSLCAAIEDHGGQRISKDPSLWESGDILVFRFDGQPQHVALYEGEGMILHAFAPAGKVIETSYGACWARRLAVVYRLSFSHQNT